MKRKSAYDNPKLEVIALQPTDVISTSDVPSVSPSDGVMDDNWDRS